MSGSPASFRIRSGAVLKELGHRNKVCSVKSENYGKDMATAQKHRNKEKKEERESKA